MEKFIPALITICGLIVSFIVLKRLYIEGRKEAKGILNPNIRMRKFKEIITFPDWYNANYEAIEDNYTVCGYGYTLDEFALELFKGNSEVTNRLKVI